MALDGKILARAVDRYEAQTRRRERDTAELRRKIYEKAPRVRQIDRLLSETAAKAVVEALSGGEDPVAAIDALRDENLALQAERAELISAMGYPIDCIDGVPACPKCSDRGFNGSKPCECLMKVYADEQRKELSSLLDIGRENFSSFSLDYYDDVPGANGISARKHMQMVYMACMRYADRFSRSGENLFLSGGTGLGKTFLSTCIAARVSEKGYSVVYETAVNLTAQCERAHFDRGGADGQDAEADMHRYMSCDLLILDDLGTELTTSFSNAALYDVINSRLRTRHSTVVSSNLGIDDIRRRYSPQIASRLEGEYENLKFYGRDIRLIKRGL